MKNILCVLLLVFSLPPLFSQGWERFYGLADALESATSIVEAPDGGLIFTMGEDGEILVRKLSIEGEEEWTRSFPSGNGSKIINSPDGYFLAGSSDGSGTALIRGLDFSGNTIWEKPEVTIDITTWVAVEDGYVSFFMDEPGDAERWKVSSTGDLLWTDTISVSGIFPGSDICSAPDGGFAIAGSSGFDAELLKFDKDGNLEWTGSGSSSINNSGNTAVTPTADGGFVVVLDLSGTDNRPSITKFAADGSMEWNSIFTPPFGDETHYVADIAEDANGDFIMAGRATGSGADLGHLLKYSGSGEFVFYKTFNGSRFSDVLATDSGFYAAVGRSFLSQNLGDAYVVLTNYEGQFYPNAVQGTLAFDDDNDCSISTMEMPLEGWTVSASGENTYYGLTDSDGNYFIEIDTGEYTLSITPPNDLWGPCENPIDITLTLGDTLTNDFPVQAAIVCPAMQVDISSPFLRRCFENEFAVEYCNLGTSTAEDATIEVTLDSLIEFVSSTLPVASQVGNVFTFDLGDVDILECGDFKITALVSCDAVLGQTLCFEAHAYPDSICGMPFNWSGASMEARAKCEGDSTVILELENVGSEPTSEELEYIVIEDQIIFFENSQIFAAGEKWSFSEPANGSTWRVISEQEPNHPGMSFPTAFVEGCGTNNTGSFSIGFANEHPMADGDGFVDIDCEEVIGAFDPNDKSAHPVGYGSEHFIEPNTDLEYRIRFQNTGTDTAFNVVIRDTLSQFLNPASLRPGASSHNYEYDLTGNGVAVFTFPNIMLPDSNVNEALSHGFVTFKISQVPDLEPETVITNSAAIYFDFNEPIITNETFHTIERDFIISVITDPSPLASANVKVYPNPFSDQATFEVEEWTGGELTLHLYDSMGRLARRHVLDGNRLVFQREDLRDGIWFFQIEAEGQSVGSGKLVVTGQ